MADPTIYSYIESEESNFQSQEIRVGDNWNWNFRDHVQLLFHLKNGVFYTGDNNWLRSFKNIMEPLINLANWTEDIEVKDILFFIENKGGRVLSFLVKKYHDEVFVKKHDMDEYIDEIAESDNAYGGTLTQKTNTARPEVLELNTVAFGDQTDIMGSPIGFKFHFTPDGLRGMKSAGWGDSDNGATISIDDLIELADNQKEPDSMPFNKTNQVTGKTIEVYIVRGNLPEAYLEDNGNFEDWFNQVQIVGFYIDEDSNRTGVTLFRKKEKEGNLKFHTSKSVHGRALGRGVGEALLHPQVWTNFLEIHKMNMLEAGSKIPLYTDDPDYANRNRIQEMENLEITVVGDGKQIRQVPTAAPANISLFTDSINQWFDIAQLNADAQDPLIGKEALSGTTFRGQERTVAQGRGPHDRRRGKRSKFIEQVYRDWIIPDMQKEILKGQKFLASLTSEEMEWISDQLATNFANKQAIEATLNGEIALTKEEYKQEFLENFLKKGNKHMVEILKQEFKDVSIKMGINIAGKQKNLADLSDKTLSIFQFAFANPQAFQQSMQIPALAHAFEDILEFSGMNQSDFSSLMKTPPPSAPVPEGQPAPELTLAEQTT